jgi:hypothetical protein
MHAVTRLATILLTVSVITGCASSGIPGHGHRDRAYDPCYSCGETLFDQVRVQR